MSERVSRWGPGVTLDGGAVTRHFGRCDLEDSPSTGWRATYALMHVYPVDRGCGN